MIRRSITGRLLMIFCLSPIQISLADVADKIYMADGETIQGTINGEIFGVYAPYGTVVLPRELLGAIQVAEDQDQLETLTTSDGDRFSGRLLESVFDVTPETGSGRYVSKDDVAKVQFAARESKQDAVEVPHRIEMVNKDAFRGFVTNPSISIETSYGEMTFKREAIQKIVLKGDNRVLANISLKAGRGSFLGRLKDQDIVILIASGQKLVTDQTEIRHIVFADAPSQESIETQAVDSVESAGSAENFRDRLKDGTSGPEMIRIAAGCYTMGSPESEAERSEDEQQHEACVEEFSIGKYEVTYADYDKFAEATGRKKPTSRKSMREEYPVISVNWNDALAYARWLSEQTGSRYRLPTEAEWEYVARAGSTTAYPWGDDLGSEKASCKDCGNAWDGKRSSPVGSFSPNAWGLHDTAGNAWEWTCSIWTDGYTGDEEVCADESDSGHRVVRGGSWYSASKFLRSAKRFKYLSGGKGSDVGFRLARD